MEVIKQFFGYGLPSTAEMFDSYYGILNDAIALLKEQDNCENCAITIEDRQPIVRCKDCKHSTIHCIESILGEPLYDCHNPNWNYDDIPTMKWNWFCADGEREEGR